MENIVTNNIESQNIITKDFSDYVVIGLGNFGKSLAVNLAEEGKNVLAIDKNAEIVESIEGHVTHAVVADATKKDVLTSLGLQNFECAIVCIGEDLASSMLISLTCKELGVPYVIAKAQTNQHKELLEKIGVNLVIFPEVFMSKKLAKALTDPLTNEIAKISNDYKIVEMICPEKWVDKSIEDVNVRKKYGISIVLIKSGENIIDPLPNTVFEKGDTLFVLGSTKNIDNVEKKIAEAVDFENRFADAATE